MKIAKPNLRLEFGWDVNEMILSWYKRQQDNDSAPSHKKRRYPTPHVLFKYAKQDRNSKQLCVDCQNK